MIVHLTETQAQATLAALESRLANLEGLLRRLQRQSKPSKRYDPTKSEIVAVRLSIAAIREAMLISNGVTEDGINF
jgi:hypothetical protein